MYVFESFAAYDPELEVRGPQALGATATTALAKLEGHPQKPGKQLLLPLKLLLMPMTWDPGKAQNAAAAAQKLSLPGTKLSS